jgi:hypothetical protein
MAAAWLAACLLCHVAQGAEVLDAKVERRAERFVMHYDIRVRAAESRVRALLTDYGNLPLLNRNIERIQVLELLPDGGATMNVVSKFCALAICLHFAWIQEVRALADGSVSVAIPLGRGDFREGSGRWRLLSEKEDTRLIFDLDLRPNFWIPPLLGPWLMQRKLAAESLDTAREIERLAASKSPDKDASSPVERGAKRLATDIDAGGFKP